MFFFSNWRFWNKSIKIPVANKDDSAYSAETEGLTPENMGHQQEMSRVSNFFYSLIFFGKFLRLDVKTSVSLILILGRSVGLKLVSSNWNRFEVSRALSAVPPNRLGTRGRLKLNFEVTPKYFHQKFQILVPKILFPKLQIDISAFKMWSSLPS